MQSLEFENRVVLNVGGTRFETYKTILKKIPATRLSRLTEALVNYDPVTNEYFFDRHPGVFSQILNYYRTGKLHYPTSVCGPLFEEELNFWGLDSNQVEPCCWKTFTKHRDTELTLTTLDRLNIDVDRTSKQDLVIKFGLNDVLPGDKFAAFKQAQPILWQLFEEPRSSNSSLAIASIQIFMICLSVALLWLKSYASSNYTTFSVQDELSSLKHNVSTSLSFKIVDEQAILLIQILDYLTHAWFTFDLSLRFMVSPDKAAFLKNMNNYIDMCVTTWFFIDAILSNYYYNHLLKAIEVFRVLRLLRLLNFHPGLRIIITSLKISASVLQLLVVVMAVSSVIFGSFIYYAEKLTTNNPDGNLFLSIPEALWYSVVSLTTIGFGDFAPVTTLGRCIGVLTVITGVLMIGLPMTIVVEIFSNFYNHLRARSKLPKQRRRILPVEAPRQRKKPGQQQQGGAAPNHYAGPKPNIKIQEAL